MGSCLIAGDSIALGIGAAFATLFPNECTVQARIGAHAAEVEQWALSPAFDRVIVSLGSNDVASGEVKRSLVRLRARLGAASVTWIYPRAAAPAWMIFRIAQVHGDGTVGINRLASRDGIHPDDYRSVSRIVHARIRISRPDHGRSAVAPGGWMRRTGRLPTVRQATPS